jgi:hypothetical protein
MPSIPRILTQARSLKLSLTHSTDYLQALRRNFTSPAILPGRSRKARIQYLAAGVASLPEDSEPSSLSHALELSQAWGENTALNELDLEEATLLPDACLRRWMTLWRSACKELALDPNEQLGQANCRLPLLSQPREVTIRSRRLGQLSLVQLGRGLFGFRCPEGGLHLPRTLVHPALFGDGYFLWNWPLMQSPGSPTLLPVVRLQKCRCNRFSSERFEPNLQGSVGCS